MFLTRKVFEEFLSVFILETPTYTLANEARLTFFGFPNKLRILVLKIIKSFKLNNKKLN
jgi:hypothetical protein